MQRASSTFPAGLDNVTLGGLLMWEKTREQRHASYKLKRMNTSAFSVSADGYEEHSMDGTDSHDYKEVTEPSDLWLDVFISEFYWWKHGPVHWRVSFAYFLSGLRCFLVVLSSRTAGTLWLTLTSEVRWGSITGSGAFWVNTRLPHVIVQPKSWASLWAWSRGCKVRASGFGGIHH